MRKHLRSLIVIAALSAVIAPAPARADQLAFSDWQATTPFDGPRTSHAAVLVNNRVYVLGGLFASGNSFMLYNDVQTAVLGNDGSIAQGSWQKTTPFREPRSGLGVVAHKGFIYVIGGFSNGGTLGDVQYAPLMQDGMIGSWTDSPHRLAIPRSNLALEALVTSSGASYLAAIAGVGEVGKDTVHFDEIETAQISADGSIGPWKSCPFHLKGGRSAPGSVVANGFLYVAGGWGDLLIEDVFSDVQYAPIRDDGCPDPWHTSAARLNMPLYGHTTALTSVTGQPTLVVLGGNAGQGNYFNNVQFAPLTAGGETGRFVFDTHQFAVPRWGHATVRYNDFLYVLGGAQRGSGGYLNDVQFTGVSRR
jgi:N-acetylneuraminic acid mutarotase